MPCACISYSIICRHQAVAAALAWWVMLLLSRAIQTLIKRPKVSSVLLRAQSVAPRRSTSISAFRRGTARVSQQLHIRTVTCVKTPYISQ